MRTGKLNWQKQDGRWYVKDAEHIDQGKTICKYTILEISFDAKKCRTRFDDLESLVPFGTHIEEFDASGKKVAERYKGGSEGQTEHELLMLARLKKSRELRGQE